MRKIIFKEKAINYLPLYNRNTERDTVEDELYKNILEDMPDLQNETQIVLIERVKRIKVIVDILKDKFDNKCQLCGFSFQKANGDYYSEAHHIMHLADGGSQDAKNVVILCPNHHRMVHHAKKVLYNKQNGKLTSITINNIEYGVNK